MNTEMNSDQLPWFDNCQSTLIQAYNNQRLPHGIVIAAPNGSGKHLFAKTFIKSLMCKQTNSSFQHFCGQCQTCLLIEADTHPDFYLLDRLTDNKGKQKKSIGIDQVRNLTRKLVEMPQLGGWRVALVLSVSDLTTASFNALLKTLEEPGQKTLLLLLTDNLHTIPATVKSRCQIVQPELKTEILAPWLIQQTNKDENLILSALKSCFNAPIKTKYYLENNGYEIEQNFNQSCDQVLTNQITPQELIGQSNLALDQICDLLANYYYQVERSILIGSGISQYQQLPKKLPFQLYGKVIEFNRAQFAGSNLQPNLQIQAILIQWFEIGRKISNLSKS